MLIVGLTGGIASGKSLVAGIFKNLGAHIIDADRIVRELLEPGQEAWKEVSGHFGNDIMTPDRRIDRGKLGRIVFSDPAKRAWLNQCLHPRVFEAYAAQVKRLSARTPDAIVVFDAALLMETGFHKKMDKTVLVYAHADQQLSRLMERDRFTPEQALARIESQMPLSEKSRHADHVIENTGTREEAERRAREVFALLKEESEKQK
ncbi:MAG: dephospho-CoA kinase [Nitrospirae bacterium RBG_19FT_COMBO_55_12]|nr:MAG: dephospho-CoA kinase [Nitrospirae bacterium RBG_19FT_COMBO_55_12]